MLVLTNPGASQRDGEQQILARWDYELPLQKKLLEQRQGRKHATIAVLHGDHGLGKTVIARRTEAWLKERRGWTVHWFSRPDLSVRPHLAKLVESLNRSVGTTSASSGWTREVADRINDLSVPQLLDRLRAWHDREQHLIVLDDVRSTSAFEPLFEFPAWSFLVTSVNDDPVARRFAPLEIAITPMSDVQAIQLACQAAGLRSPDHIEQPWEVLDLIERSHRIPWLTVMLARALAEGSPTANARDVQWRSPQHTSNAADDQIRCALRALAPDNLSTIFALAILPPLQLPDQTIGMVAKLPADRVRDSLAALQQAHWMQTEPGDRARTVQDRVRAPAIDELRAQGEKVFAELYERAATAILRLTKDRVANVNHGEQHGQSARDAGDLLEPLLACLTAAPWPADAPGGQMVARAMMLAYRQLRARPSAQRDIADRVLTVVTRLAAEDDWCAGAVAAERARRHLDLDGTREALTEVDTAIRHYRAAGEEGDAIDAMLTKAALLISMDDLDEASRQLQAIEGLTTRPGVAQDLRRDALTRVIAYERSPQEKNCIKLVSALDDIACRLSNANDPLGSLDMQQRAIHALSGTHGDGRVASAAALTKRIEAAMELAKRHGLMGTWARLLMQRGRLLCMLPDLDKAMEVFEFEGLSHAVATCSLWRADLLLDRKNPHDPQAIKSATALARTRFQLLGHRQGMAEAAMLSAAALIARLESRSATERSAAEQEELRSELVEERQRCEQAVEVLGSTPHGGRAHYWLAEICREQEDYDAALRHYRAARRAYGSVEDLHGCVSADYGVLIVLIAQRQGSAPQLAPGEWPENALRALLVRAQATRNEHVTWSVSRALGDDPMPELLVPCGVEVIPRERDTDKGLAWGQDVRDGRRVIVRLCAASDTAERGCFDHESFVLQRLRIAWMSLDGITRVAYDGMDAAGRRVLILDPGTARALPEDPQAWSRVRPMLLRALALLQSVHQEGVTHGAIARHTLLIDEADQPCLVGFVRPNVSFETAKQNDIKMLLKLAISLLLGDPRRGGVAQAREEDDRAVPRDEREGVGLLDQLITALDESPLLDAEAIHERLCEPATEPPLDALLREGEIEHTASALRSGRDVALDGTDVAGCHAVARAVARALAAEQIPVLTWSPPDWAAPDCVDLLRGVVDDEQLDRAINLVGKWLDEKARVSGVVEELRRLLQRGAVIIYAPPADQPLPESAFDVLVQAAGRQDEPGLSSESTGRRGAILWVRPPSRQGVDLRQHMTVVTLSNFDQLMLGKLFIGIDPILHEQNRAMRRIWSSTLGIPDLVRHELGRWLRLGWVEHSPGENRLRLRAAATRRAPVGTPSYRLPSAPRRSGALNLDEPALGLLRTISLVWPECTTEQAYAANIPGMNATTARRSVETLKQQGLVREDLVDGRKVLTPLVPLDDARAEVRGNEVAQYFAGRLLADDPRRVSWMVPTDWNPPPKTLLSAASIALEQARRATAAGDFDGAVDRLDVVLSILARIGHPSLSVAPEILEQRTELELIALRTWATAAIGDARAERLGEALHVLRGSSSVSQEITDLHDLIAATLAAFYPALGVHAPRELAAIEGPSPTLEVARRAMLIIRASSDAARAQQLLDEARRWVDEARLDPTVRADAHSRLFNTEGALAYRENELDRSQQAYRRAAELRKGTAWAGASLCRAAAALAETDRLDEARPLIDEAIGLVVKHGNAVLEAQALWVQGLIEYRSRSWRKPDLDRVRALQHVGERRIEAQVLVTEAAFAWRWGVANPASDESAQLLAVARGWLFSAVATATEIGQLNLAALAEALLLVLEQDHRVRPRSVQTPSHIAERIPRIAERARGQDGDLYGVETIGLLATVATAVAPGLMASLRRATRDDHSAMLQRKQLRHRLGAPGLVLSWGEALARLDLISSEEQAKHALSALLAKLFDPGGLRIYATHTIEEVAPGAEIWRKLPGPVASHESLCDALAHLLVDHPVRGELIFATLRRCRPHQQQIIDALELQWVF